MGAVYHSLAANTTDRGVRACYTGDMDCTRVPYEKILFVCTNERETGACCGKRGSTALRDALKAAITARGLKGRVRVARSDCLDRCNQGPNVMVFPDQQWYAGVTLADVPRIIAECFGEA